jgi:hypothetical protein
MMFSELGFLSSKDQGARDDVAVKHLGEAQGSLCETVKSSLTVVR